MYFRVVDTDNFGGDYPDEKFVTPKLTQATAQLVADELNAAAGYPPDRYYKVVKDFRDKPYQLAPGFEP